ncbi:MAG TPA: DNRLRE domain-containing protein [Solirubrobacteraceae bacterium]|jgi:hypothetical protein|nr:DNRLRE domain-containing protein [Solirubrobacteraceae bacterium]
MRAVVSTMLALMFGGGVSLMAGSAQSVPARAAAVRQVAHAMPRAAVSTSVGSVADCTLFSGSPTSSARCGAGSDDTVGTDGNGAFYRTMVSFTNLSIPAGSTVDSATLTIQALGAFGSTNATVVDMTRAFTAGAATWNTYDGVHGWSTPGGDYGASPNTVVPVSGAGAVSFSIPELVQPWVSGTNTVRQLEIVGFTGTGNAFTMAHGPTLSVTYTPPPPPTTTTGTTPTSTSPTTTTGPVVTTPVPTPLPVAHGARALRVKVVLSWTWNGARIRLRKVKVGTMPGATKLTMSCQGGGCPRHSKSTVAGARKVRRALLRMAGRRYRAGDVLSLKLTAAGWRQERARIFFRNGKRPLILG